MTTTTVEEKTKVNTANEFIKKYGVEEKEITETFPNYPKLKKKHGKDLPIYEILDTPDREIIEKILEKRKDLFHITYRSENMGFFIIEQVTTE